MEAELENKLLAGVNTIHELGRQRCFELGNPYYSQFREDQDGKNSNYYRKEMPTGEIYLVNSVIIFNDGVPIDINDTVIRQLA
jgi:hypothetical protein